MKKIILGLIALGNVGFASSTSSLANVTAENTASFVRERESTRGKKIIYVADEFHKMATVPSFTFGAPSGLVSSWGVAFAGLSGRANSEVKDGAFAMGMGFGDSDKIGGSASLGIGSIDPRDGGAFNRGSLNLTVGHHFKEMGAGLSLGVNNIDLWHKDDLDGDKQDPSFFTSFTKLIPNEVAPIAITGGLGNNGYVDITTDSDRKNKIGVFGAVAVYVLPQVSLVLDYTTGITTFGTSLVPFPDYPVTLNLGAGNLFKQGAEEKVSFVGSLAAAYVF